jgi:hypothetical protein
MPPVKPRSYPVWEIVIVALAFVVINILGAKFQKQISYNEGKGWEGVGYYQVAQEFAEGKPIAAEAPYVYRVGTPFLVAKVAPHDIFLGYKIVNTAANALTLLLLVAWLRLYLRDWRVRVGLILLFLLQWDTPVRWLWFYPAHTDPWLWVFLLSGLIAIHHYRNGDKPRLWLAALCGLSAVGVLFREVALAIPLVFLFAFNPLERKARWQTERHTDGSLWLNLESDARSPRWVEFLPLVCGLLMWLILKQSVTQTDEYSFLRTAAQWARGKSPISYLHGWMLAYGVVIFLPVYFWRQSVHFLKTYQHFLVYVLFFALMGYIGGSDTERLLYWSMPIVFLLIGRAIENNAAILRSVPLILIVGACQLIGSRAFLLTPDYTHGIASHSIPFFTPLRDAYFMDLFSFHGTPRVELISLLQYGAFAGILWFWLARRRRALSHQAVVRQSQVPLTSAHEPMMSET